MADGSIRFTIKDFDLKPTREDLRRRHKRGQLAFAPMFIRDAERLVPLKDGPLRASAHPVNGGKQAVYDVISPKNGYPYAPRLFYEQFMNYTTPGTGPRWDLRAEGLFATKWVSELERIMS